MIDIIIPVYNTPINDLERCLNSINEQTFKEFTVYIIDDGSNNEIRNFLDNYVDNNTSFIVKHIKNSGVSNARNLGIEISSSKYLTFLDADDTITPTFLEEAFNIAEAYNLDLIIGGYNEVVNNQITKVRLSEPGLHIYEKERINNFMEKLLSSKTNERNKEIGNCPTGRIYTRLFKRSSIKNLRFIPNIMSEDTLFMIDYTYKANKIGIVNKIWYNYFINGYSISNNTKKEKMINNIKAFIKEIEKRKNLELNPIIKAAYDSRITKANNYIEDIKNNNL